MCRVVTGAQARPTLPRLTPTLFPVQVVHFASPALFKSLVACCLLNMQAKGGSFPLPYVAVFLTPPPQAPFLTYAHLVTFDFSSYPIF